MSDVRVRPALRAVTMVAAIILLPVAAHGGWDYIELRRLVREIESIRAKGEPVSEPPNSSARPPAASGTPDAAGYYLAGSMLALEAEASPVVTPVQEWFAAQSPDPQVLQQLAVPLGEFVAGTREAVALADRAAALPFDGFPGGTEFSYRASGMAHLWSLVNARTFQLSVAGEGDAAAESLLSSLKVRAALRDGGAFMSPDDRQLAAMLSLTHPSAASLQRLNEAFASEDKPEARVAAFLQQRGRYLGLIWRRYYGSDPDAPRQYSLPMRSVSETVLRPWITHRIVAMLRLWAELADAAKVPWPKKAAAGSRIIERNMPEARSSSVVLGSLPGQSAPISAFKALIDATTLIVDRSSRVALAIEQFERDRSMRPASLAELVPQYLTAIPADPYTGGSLNYRRQTDRYTVYSVGPDEKDDGGDITSEFEAAVARGQKYRRISGKDVGVTVLVRP